MTSTSTFASDLRWAPSVTEHDLGHGTTVRGVAEGRPASASIDPGVEQGTLAALGRPDTVAISRDAALSNGQGLGDRVRFRYGNRHERAAEVVAIYDRGLGFGDYLFEQRTLRAQDPGSIIDIVLVTAAPR